eukprot:scaffold321525_cov18-Prasinocladus_malaysianus.AAC.1
MCSSGSLKEASSLSSFAMSQVIDANVVNAWQTCIQTCKVEQKGITAAVTYANDQRTATMTVVFDKTVDIDAATILAVAEIGEIECQCYGQNWSDCKQPVDLEQGLSYHILCNRPDVGSAFKEFAFPPASATVLTSVGATLRLVLPEEVPPTTAAVLENQFATLQASVQQLETDISGLAPMSTLEGAIATAASSLSSQIAAKSSLHDVYLWMTQSCYIELDGQNNGPSKGSGFVGDTVNFDGMDAVLRNFDNVWDDDDKIYVRVWCDAP